MKVNNDDIWKRVKSGEVKGVSLEGFFDLDQEVILDEQEIEAIIKNIL
jgi:hypothetical protein